VEKVGDGEKVEKSQAPCPDSGVEKRRTDDTTTLFGGSDYSHSKNYQSETSWSHAQRSGNDVTDLDFAHK
jgi:hypothetical protein